MIDAFSPQDRDLLTLADHQTAARRRLPREVADHIDAPTGDGAAAARAQAAFDRILLRPRALRAMDEFDLSTVVLGRRVALPVLLGPSGSHGIAHPDAERATARAAAEAGTIMVLSSGSSLPTSQIVAATDGPLWYQAYLYRDPRQTERALRTAVDGGFAAICLTIDALATPPRVQDRRNRYAPPPSPNLPIDDVVPTGPLPSAAIRRRLDWSASWDAVKALRDRSPLPIVVKGVLHPDDARRAVDAGAAAIIVSDHGGRILDGAMSPIEALPDVADVVAGQVEVLLDGGIRRGTDVVKAISCGATATLIGRPVFWGLATGGRSGVVRVLRVLQEEIESAMVACGAARITDLGPDLLAGPRPGRSAR